jgi:hypothetical protein
MRHHTHTRFPVLLPAALGVLWTSACRRDHSSHATDGAVIAHPQARQDARTCEEQVVPARRRFSTVVWDCIEKLEGPRPLPLAISLTMQPASDASTGIVFSVDMLGPQGRASKELEGAMVKCATEEYERCPASYHRALWRWKDAKLVRMGRPNRDNFGPEGIE